MKKFRKLCIKALTVQRNSLVIQWLGLLTSTARGTGLVPGGQTKLLYSMLLCLVAQSRPTLCNPRVCSPPASPVHGDSPGKNTEVGCHALLQGIFPTQGLDPSLPHWSILYHLSPRGSPFHSIVTCYKVIHFSFVYFWVCLVFVATHRLSLAVLRRLRIAMAPLVAEHRL